MRTTNTIVIIQARVGSSRLPNKVLKKLIGKTVISHIINRCNQIDGVRLVCCAIPDDQSNDVLAQEIKKTKAELYRGSEIDVLNRYFMAAKYFDAKNIVRVTGDCPLLDPAVCTQLLGLFVESSADYATNNFPPSWPHGLDCEVVSSKWLARANREATNKFDREHVTPYIREHAEVKKLNLKCSVSGLKNHRWTLDTRKDFEFLSKVFASFSANEIPFDYTEVLKIIENNPEIALINKDEKTPSRQVVN